MTLIKILLQTGPFCFDVLNRTDCLTELMSIIHIKVANSAVMHIDRQHFGMLLPVIISNELEMITSFLMYSH